MKKEINKLKLNEKVLYDLIWGDYQGKKFRIKSDKITSSDNEDGGASHTIIIEDLETNKTYRGYYTDWDIYYNFNYDDEEQEVIRCDFDSELEEVKSYKKTITEYK